LDRIGTRPLRLRAAGDAQEEGGEEKGFAASANQAARPAGEGRMSTCLHN
jgi:hypothetical protein